MVVKKKCKAFREIDGCLRKNYDRESKKKYSVNRINFSTLKGKFDLLNFTPSIP